MSCLGVGSGKGRQIGRAFLPLRLTLSLGPIIFAQIFQWPDLLVGTITVAAKDDYLIEKLVELGYVTSEQVAPLQVEAESSGHGVVDLLLERKVITPAIVTACKAAQFGAEVVSLAGLRLEDDVIASIPRHIAKKYRVIPVYAHANSIVVALSDPSDLDTIDSLHHLLKADVEVRVATEEDIDAALKKYYGAADDSVGKMIQDITEGEVEIGLPGGGGRTRAGPPQAGDAPLGGRRRRRLGGRH